VKRGGALGHFGEKKKKVPPPGRGGGGGADFFELKGPHNRCSPGAAIQGLVNSWGGGAKRFFVRGGPAFFRGKPSWGGFRVGGGGGEKKKPTAVGLGDGAGCKKPRVRGLHHRGQKRGGGAHQHQPGTGPKKLRGTGGEAIQLVGGKRKKGGHSFFRQQIMVFQFISGSLVYLGKPERRGGAFFGAGPVWLERRGGSTTRGGRGFFPRGFFFAKKRVWGVGGGRKKKTLRGGGSWDNFFGVWGEKRQPGANGPFPPKRIRFYFRGKAFRAPATKILGASFSKKKTPQNDSGGQKWKKGGVPFLLGKFVGPVVHGGNRFQGGWGGGGTGGGQGVGGGGGAFLFFFFWGLRVGFRQTTLGGGGAGGGGGPGHGVAPHPPPEREGPLPPRGAFPQGENKNCPPGVLF